MGRHCGQMVCLGDCVGGHWTDGVLRRLSGYYSSCVWTGVVFYETFHVESCTALCSLVCSSFSIVITSLGVKRGSGCMCLVYFLLSGFGCGL